MNNKLNDEYQGSGNLIFTPCEFYFFVKETKGIAPDLPTK